MSSFHRCKFITNWFFEVENEQAFEYADSRFVETRTVFVHYNVYSKKICGTNLFPFLMWVPEWFYKINFGNLSRRLGTLYNLLVLQILDGSCEFSVRFQIWTTWSISSAYGGSLKSVFFFPVTSLFRSRHRLWNNLYAVIHNFRFLLCLPIKTGAVSILHTHRKTGFCFEALKFCFEISWKYVWSTLHIL